MPEEATPTDEGFRTVVLLQENRARLGRSEKASRENVTSSKARLLRGARPNSRSKFGFFLVGVKEDIRRLGSFFEQHSRQFGVKAAEKSTRFFASLSAVLVTSFAILPDGVDVFVSPRPACSI